MLWNERMNDPRIATIIQTFSSPKKGSADVEAAFRMAVQVSDEAHLERCIGVATAMVRYMQPTAEDMVTLLLWDGYRRMAFRVSHFQEYFRGGQARRYYERVTDALRCAQRREGRSEEECVERYIMLRVADGMYDTLVGGMAKRGMTDTVCVWQAYELARRAHYWDEYRLSGEHYLAHPLRVAAVLADIGADSAVVAAALLHDTVEDTACTLETIAKKCGRQIACYVDAVTSVHRMYSESVRRAEYQSDKHEMDEKSFEKLANAVLADASMVPALYIKAADRIDNLRTMDAVDSIRRHDKSDETEADYLPLFRRFGLSYLADWIEDLMWRATNPTYYEQVKAAYEQAIAYNRGSIDATFSLLRGQLGEAFSRLFKDGDLRVQVMERRWFPLEVHNRAQMLCGPTDVTASFMEKQQLPLCDAQIVFESKDAGVNAAVVASSFLRHTAPLLAAAGRVVADVETDTPSQVILRLEDGRRHAIRCCFLSAEDYRRTLFGTCMPLSESDVPSLSASGGETVFIKLRNGTRRAFPKGATVLDVAFSIHEEVGLAARGAWINGHRAAVYHVLHDGDRVVVEADTYKENGRVMKFIPHARIGWLQAVRTDTARKKLIRYLERKYEGDNPRYEAKSGDGALHTASERYLADVKGVYADDE